MTREKFLDLVKDPSNASRVNSGYFSDLLNQFPYCQPLRILQLKQLKDQDSVHYPQQLKITAAYAPDRTRLFSLMHEKTEAYENENIGTLSGPVIFEHVEFPVAEVNIFSEMTETIPDQIESNDEPEEFEIVTGVFISEEENIDSKVEESTLSPAEIIELRLKELNLWKQETEQELKIEVEEYLHEAETELAIDNMEPVETEKDLPEVDSGTFDSALESFDVPEMVILELKDEPEAEKTNEVIVKDFSHEMISAEFEIKNEIHFDKEIIPDSENKIIQETESLNQEKEIQQPDSGVHSFTEWLRSSKAKSKVNPEEKNPDNSEIQNSENKGPEKNNPTVFNAARPRMLYMKSGEESSGELKPASLPFFEKDKKENTGTFQEGTFNQITQDPIPEISKPKSGKEELIEKFIKQEPRISPAKSGFYSATNMAKKSIEEPEDLVTETLARIYAQQGNYQKALSFYEKLSLKFPEKSLYFAPFIEDLKNKLNS